MVVFDINILRIHMVSIHFSLPQYDEKISATRVFESRTPTIKSLYKYVLNENDPNLKECQRNNLELELDTKRFIYIYIKC